jgi:dipeptidyl aminopeptidase/acylaminoacyl peptidase
MGAMRPYISRLSLVAGIFILSISLGVVTQQGGRLPLIPDQLGSTGGVYEFSWAPDGKSIAYVSSQGGQPEIWTIPAAGGDPKRLSTTGSMKREPRWSNDGKWIAYVDSGGGQSEDIQIISADGEVEFTLDRTSAREHHPRWSPNSRQLAFIQESQNETVIAVADIDTRQLRRIAEAPASDLQWSPDGRSIVFVSDPLIRTDDRRDNQDIFLIPVEGGNPRLLTPGTPRFRELAPSWAPDSRQIAFTSDSSGFSNIFVVDSETGIERSIASAMTDQLSPKWSRDGRSIAFVQNENGQFNLWVVPVEGGRPLRVSELEGVNGGFDNESATPYGSYEWSPDGKRIAFTHSDPGRTSDIWVTTPGAGRSIQLTNSMPGELRREARFIWPETTTYRSFDGTEMRALVYKPRGIKPKAGHPALLMFRDSVDGQNALSWDPFIQFFVSDGYVVFAPNVRGSSGQGKDFRQLVFEHGGDHDVRDAFIGLDKLSSEGLIDTRRLGVFGAGTGGFLATAALIKDEARFKAAVCLYGIMDAVTAASYPSMSEWTRYMIGSTPMSNPLAFYERSLVNFVDKLRTPIIFLYAQNDTAAPFQQLQQFAVQAEVKGKWFDYRVFEDEPRAWQQWRPNDLRQALEAMDALFEKHVLGKDREIRLSRNR